MTTQSKQRSPLETHYECVQFYNREASLLDDFELEAWKDLLTEDIHYEMPRRVTRERDSDQPVFVDEFFYRENKESISKRIEKLNHPAAWAVNPLPRSRRFVTNVRVNELAGDEIMVTNNQLVATAQREQPEPIILSMERHDTLRHVDGDLKLAERRILLDHTVLPIADFTLFL